MKKLDIPCCAFCDGPLFKEGETPARNRKYCSVKCRRDRAQRKFRGARREGNPMQGKSDAWKKAVYTTPVKALESCWKRCSYDVERKLKGRVSFDLSLDEYGGLIFKRCHYCLAAPSIKMHTGQRLRNTIDRVDSEGHYTKDNCVTACWACNKMKGTLSYSKFLEMVQRITEVAGTSIDVYGTELHMRDRAKLYNDAFPNYPNVWFDKGWLLGVWNIGNNYKGSGFHGSYPPSYLKRITSMFPDMEDVLHLFSGSLPVGDYTRIDLNADLKPDVVGNAEELSTLFDADSFDIIYADPPYTESDALKYGNPMVNRNKVVKECHKVLKPGGFLCWMDMVLPMYRKIEFQRVGEISISRSTNHRIRGVYIFRKKA